MKQRSSNRRSGQASGGTGRMSAESPIPDNVAVLDEDDALSVLEALAGSIEGPADWSAEHDHYLYGTPKRSAKPA
jgi:hypothetical protein